MSLALFIGSLVVLALGLLIAGFGYYIGHKAQEKHSALNCGSLFSNYRSGGQCTTQTFVSGVGLGGILTAGIFIILGLITSIIFGVKLLMERRKKKEEIGNIK